MSQVDGTFLKLLQARTVRQAEIRKAISWTSSSRQQAVVGGPPFDRVGPLARIQEPDLPSYAISITIGTLEPPTSSQGEPNPCCERPWQSQA